MDVSVLASVGSFVVSERVLKPKASVLIILGCVLAYDLTTKTHDISSLRVYRGPALMAFTLMMCAYALRTWRRNGVACDELLFLPGTAHFERLVDSPEPSSRPAPESDVAAGVGFAPNNARALELTPMTTTRSTHTSDHGRSNNNNESPVRSRTLSKESSISSIQEFADSWDGEEDDDEVDNNNEEDDLTSPLTATVGDQVKARTPSRDSSVPTAGNLPNDEQQQQQQQGPVQRFRENHPRITRLGSFFFFRSSSSTTQNAAYAPSGPMVFGAALDLSMPILFNFHLFIEAYNHVEAYGSETPAKILPLIFLSVLIVRSFIPPGRRGRFWNTIKFTVTAPFHHCRFRDAFIGDVLTSLVRPMQDILFALSYYVTVIWGTVSGEYGLSASGSILESSWILHNVILPSCALLPLWWKFLQTLRQAYDTGKRWPHLGNAFKYLLAAIVILYGMTHPEDRRSPWWLVCFALALVYQVWWDTFMDWELLVIVPRGDETLDCESSWFHNISSYRPNSCVLPLHVKCFQPVRDCIHFVFARIPSYRQVKLRPRRLYKSDSFYWKIFIYNTVLRFTWMICFIPAYHLSPSGHKQIHAFSSDTNSYIGVLLPAAEILRRALWSFLLLEMETIKMQDGNPSYWMLESSSEGLMDESESNTSVDSSKIRYLPTWLGSPQQIQRDGANASRCRLACFQWDEETREKLFVVELFLWAIAFVGIGLWATG